MKIKELYSRCDRHLLVILGILLATGLLLIYSADNSTGNFSHFNRQLIFLGLGIVLLILSSSSSLSFYSQISGVFYLMCLIGLVSVKFFGVSSFGAKRWIEFMGLKAQPSEPAKLAFIIFLARLLGQLRMDELGFKSVFITAAVCIPMAGLVYIQPDLGTSTIFPAVGMIMLAWAGLPLWFFVMGAIPIIGIFFKPLPWLVGLGVGLGLIYLWRAGIKWYYMLGVLLLTCGSAILAPQLWDHLKPYQKERIISFLNPENDPRRSGYQILQSKVAIGSGGIWGKGYLKGTQTQRRFIPQRHTDFIFAILGEELGWVGASGVLFLFYSFLRRGIKIAREAKSGFASLVAIGVVGLVGYHLLVNVGMATGLLPVTGLPLPFLSYGGSFLLTMMMATGLLLSVSIYKQE
ncbi:MAG: rod shape-determining protein RodA [bacterium]